MNDRDFAVVVGISKYGSLRPELEGPERDANAFADWLESPDGGAVPSQNVTRILSSRFANVNAALGDNIFGYQPTLSAMTEAFFPLIQRAVKNSHVVPRVGRRLYIYMSGHGMTPRADPNTSTNNSALAPANWMADVNLECISGQAWAEWFRLSHAFSEIVLFMDCCRTDMPDVPPTLITTPPVRGGRPEEVQVFYAWATQWDSRAWEQPLGSPAAKRGVFTYALLEALREAPDEQGRITPKGIAGYVDVRVRQLRQDDLPQLPRFHPPQPDGSIVIVPQVKARPESNVSITFDAALIGQTATVQDTTFASIASHTISDAPWTLALTPGTYTLIVGGKDRGLVVRPGGQKVQHHIDA